MAATGTAAEGKADYKNVAIYKHMRMHVVQFWGCLSQAYEDACRAVLGVVSVRHKRMHVGQFWGCLNQAYEDADG